MRHSGHNRSAAKQLTIPIVVVGPAIVLLLRVELCGGDLAWIIPLAANSFLCAWVCAYYTHSSFERRKVLLACTIAGGLIGGIGLGIGGLAVVSVSLTAMFAGMIAGSIVSLIVSTVLCAILRLLLRFAQNSRSP